MDWSLCRPVSSQLCPAVLPAKLGERGNKIGQSTGETHQNPAQKTGAKLVQTGIAECDRSGMEMSKQSDRSDWSVVWEALAEAIRDESLFGEDKKLKKRPRIQAFVSTVLGEAFRRNIKGRLDEAAAEKARRPTDETLGPICEAFNQKLKLNPPLTPDCLRTETKDQLRQRLGISPPTNTELYLQRHNYEFLLGEDFAAIDVVVGQGYALEAMLEFMLQPFRSSDGRFEFGASEAMLVVRLACGPKARIDSLIQDDQLPREAPRWRVRRDGLPNSAIWRVTSLANGSVTGLCNFDTPLLKASDVQRDDRLIFELRIERSAQKLMPLGDSKVPTKAKQEMIEAVFRRAQREAGAQVETDIGPVHIVLARVEAIVCERPVDRRK